MTRIVLRCRSRSTVRRAMHEPSFGVILGTGVGGGIVVDGRLLQGRNGIAGEWGHTPIPYLRDGDALESRLEDRPCYCGRDELRRDVSCPDRGSPRTHRRFVGRVAKTVRTSRPQPIRTACARSNSIAANSRDRSRRSSTSSIRTSIVLGGGVSQIDALYQRVPELWRGYVFSDTVSNASASGAARRNQRCTRRGVVVAG